MAITVVKLNVTNASNSERIQYVEDNNGRINALKETLPNNDIKYYVITKKIFDQLHFRYTDIYDVMFKSANLDFMVRVSQISMTADDTTYVQVNQDGSYTIIENPYDEQNILLPGLITEAQYFEQALGGTLANFSVAAILRKEGKQLG